MESKLALAIGSVILGFAIGQANKLIDQRFERKKILRRALSEMLDIRFRLKVSAYILLRLTEVKVERADFGKVIAQLPKQMFWEEKLSERFDETVSQMSEYLPILAFSLRSKDVIGKINGQHVESLAESGEGAFFFVGMLARQEKELMPELDGLITGLADACGRKQRRWVREHLEETAEVPPATKDWTDQVIAELNSKVGLV